ncbi:MAG TPA: ribosome-associated translation inhibitor RaiA [Azospirillaceae bacterium]|nr:ribosome-associated translation inhibitor RaiA [Azospirillaceae bacterium]
MHLSVKGKQIDVGDALRTHVAESLNSVVSKYFGKPMEANVTFSRDAHLYKADIHIHVGRNIMLQATAEATEPYPAFDTAADKIAKRLRRYKRRLRGHQTAEHHGLGVDGSYQPIKAKKYILEPEPDDTHLDGEDASVEAAAEAVQPIVVAEMDLHIDILTVGEAVMRMDLADLPALMFRNRAHGELNVVYRRADGNISWVDPTGEKKGNGAA